MPTDQEWWKQEFAANNEARRSAFWLQLWGGLAGISLGAVIVTAVMLLGKL